MPKNNHNTLNAFSIIVPLYNPYNQYYDALLESIINQSYSNFECLLIYYDKIPNFNTSLDNRFKLIESNSESVTSKRNIGILNAKNEYIVFCDSDDFIGINLLFEFNKTLSLFDYDLICALHTTNHNNLDTSNNSQNILITDKNTIYDYLFGEFKNSHIKYNHLFASIWSKCFKKDIITTNKISFINPPCTGEDMLFVIKYCKHINNMALIQYRGYYWRINNLSVTHSPNSFSFDIEPFCKYLKIEVNKFDNDYYKYLDTYLGKRIIYTVHYIFKCHFKSKTDKLIIKTLFNRAIPKNGESHKCLVLMKTSGLSFYTKVFRLLLIKRLYLLIYLVEYCRFKLKK